MMLEPLSAALSITAGGETINIAASLLNRATRDDRPAMALMFRQFIPDDEALEQVEYLGIEGFWGMGTHNFACLTPRRAAAMRVGRFGKVVYQDVEISDLNRSKVHQPSIWRLYVGGIIACPALTAALGQMASESLLSGFFSLFLLLVAIRVGPALHHRLFKCGFEFWAKEGPKVYIFTHRRRLNQAQQLRRKLSELQERHLTCKVSKTL